MKTLVAKLKSASPYSQGRYYDVPKLPKETAKAYEERTWRERMHTNDDGHVFIPANAFKNCLDAGAKYVGKQIPGKGKERYTRHFESGVMVVDPLVLPIKKEDVEGQWLFVPSDGRPQGGKRVHKCFPLIREWEGEVTFYVLDDLITIDVFREALEEAGRFIGLGVWRPSNRGSYGRFSATSIREA